ncbi:helix-turn-helix transcriptional regulator [Calditrichota bacterium]
MKITVSNKIKYYRSKSNFTQEDLAKEVGVSRQSIISIERGHYIPSLTLALKFAQLFQCSTDDLFKLVEVK